MKTKEEKTRIFKDFTDSLYYHVCLTEKCFKILAKHVEMKLELPVSLDELSVLHIIRLHNGEIHQRDIAKMILKDRANTGRLLDNLEKDGYLEKHEIIKNKRQAKALTITQLGLETLEASMKQVQPIFEGVHNKIPAEDVENVKEILSKFRDRIKEVIEIHI